ncbi:jg24974 [Pararge aegeria aegeria]|uniref:Jg24974 protein n=1 Tax=Pararge aegeria aegeria TaxID=348720 RepID=A0A8S4S4Z1_9NEOP|nr:jg24974 [Pararge aegeria aegeria]
MSPDIGRADRSIGYTSRTQYAELVVQCCVAALRAEGAVRPPAARAQCARVIRAGTAAAAGGAGERARHSPRGAAVTCRRGTRAAAAPPPHSACRLHRLEHHIN